MRFIFRSSLVIVAAVLGALPLVVLAAGSGGVTGPALYEDGTLYRTVGTPTDFSSTGAPIESFDVLYQFFGLQPNVITAAPGDDGFNGGRWMVHGLSFSDYAGAVADPQVDVNDNDVLDSDEEVLGAMSHGYATDIGVVRTFQCPVIHVPGT